MRRFVASGRRYGDRIDEIDGQIATPASDGLLTKGQLGDSPLRIRRRRQRLAAGEVAAASVAVGHRVAEVVGPSERIAAYVPTRGEIDPMAGIRSMGAHSIGLPTVLGKEMEFRLVALSEANRSSGSTDLHQRFEQQMFEPQLESGRFGILQPPETAPPVDLGSVQVMLVPLVAFDEQGHRIGHGRGYYDRALARIPPEKRPRLIGLAYEFQRLEAWLPDPWDIPLDLIVTPDRVIQPR